MAASRRVQVELASDIAEKSLELMRYDRADAVYALSVVAKVSPSALAWLRDRLLDITQQRPFPAKAL